MKIELWATSCVKPYPGNPRVNDSAVDAVAVLPPSSVPPADRCGLRRRHHRRPHALKAALKLGLKQVPVHVAKDLTPAQIKAYRIADNKTGEWAEWDFDLLPIELSALEGMDFDLSLLGFSQDELTELMAPPVNDGLCDPDEIPEPPDEAVTKLGDLYELGNHRLLCGDSSKAEDVDRLLDGAKIHLVNTDPPYNVNVEPASNGADTGGQRPGKRPLRNTPSWRSLEGQRARGIKPPEKNRCATKKDNRQRSSARLGTL